MGENFREGNLADRGRKKKARLKTVRRKKTKMRKDWSHEQSDRYNRSTSVERNRKCSNIDIDIRLFSNNNLT